MQISLLIQMLREKIEPKLIYSPFLRLIIFNVWFQLGFAAVLLTLVSAGLYLPKMWRVSPAGFEPIIHISGLDMTQNWALKRSARKLQAAGDFVKAGASWQSAVSENPADLSALHGFLENSFNFQRAENRFTTPLLSQMQWLLRINQTNSADVDLIARVCDHFSWYDVAAYFLGPVPTSAMSDQTEAIFIKTLFNQSRIAEFADLLEKRGAALKDPELPLYRLAYQAGWNKTGSAEAFTQLERAAEGGGNAERAGHLLLRAAVQKNRIDLYSRELDRLVSRNEANAADQAWYWMLLASNGRTNEAVKLAQAASVTPASMMELIRVSQGYVSLGLVDNAAEMLKRLAPQFGGAPEVWLTYGRVLEQRQDWDEMRTAGRTIRQVVALRETAWGYSYFLEGRADLAQKREASAQTAFDRAAESAYDNENVGLVVGRELTRLKYPKAALRVYDKIQPKFEKSFDYWNDVFAAAYAAQDINALLKATEHAYHLNPRDVVALNHYAAVLLLSRTRPEEAIQLTLQLYTKFPQSATTVINHSCALLLNNRAQEARKLLETVDVRTLGSLEISPYYMALFETYHSLKMWDRAWKARENITESALFPIERERLSQEEKNMPKRLAKTL